MKEILIKKNSEQHVIYCSFILGAEIAGHEERMLVVELSGPSKEIPQGVLADGEGKLLATHSLHKKAKSAVPSPPKYKVTVLFII